MDHNTNGAATELKRGAKRVQKRAKSSARRLKKAAEHETNGIWQEVKSGGVNARKAAHRQMRQMRDQAEHYLEEGRDYVVEAEQSLEDKVRENPWRALLIAAGVGLAGGLILFRRSH